MPEAVIIGDEPTEVEIAIGSACRGGCGAIASAVEVFIDGRELAV